jgi:hypothetical protein
MGLRCALLDRSDAWYRLRLAPLRLASLIAVNLLGVGILYSRHNSKICQRIDIARLVGLHSVEAMSDFFTTNRRPSSDLP